MSPPADAADAAQPAKIRATGWRGRSIPVVISTWPHGLAANAAAWKILATGGRALDAVEQGARVVELDPAVNNVGYGGLPDRAGEVTLDACIMDEAGNCGAVACLRHIKNPVSVARLVMEKSPHVMLVGEGAEQFALAHGFKKENLLTAAARAAWKKWRRENLAVAEKIDVNNHDTIGMLAIDRRGNLAGSCTTSGTAWKYPGRVGDSPIIGAGLFVDNEIGGAAATGRGESVMKIAGAMVVVEAMRHGLSPLAACREAVRRIAKKQNDYQTFQVGFIALNKKGEFGAYSIKQGFEYAVCARGENKLYPSEYWAK
jgi:isoaspartyl peptidase/L-asparaginase-like protein (Ntn-hydrolase superfamily)